MISDVIIDWLVMMYADDDQLQWKTGSFSTAAKSSRMKTLAGMHVEWKSVNALYVPDAHAIVINSDADIDDEKFVKSILHEIMHYNQHIRWDKPNNIRYRQLYLRGKKKPNDVKQDSTMIDVLDWDELTQFWERKYGYGEAPHEVEARQFAESTVDEAMAFIAEHFENESL